VPDDLGSRRETATREECTAQRYQANSPQQALALLKTGQPGSEEVEDPVELAAWTQLCRVILNLHETITR
jgi:hypothetical protein